MKNKALALVLWVSMLLCLTACGKGVPAGTEHTLDSVHTGESTDSTTLTHAADEETPDEEITDEEITDEETAGEESPPQEPVFKTENITRITFYAYYGAGTGSDVPAEHMADIINWLDTFTLGKQISGLIPPGTNTIVVEITYADGSVIKQGLDTITVGGIDYYTRRGTEPDCYWEILSRTSIS